MKHIRRPPGPLPESRSSLLPEGFDEGIVRDFFADTARKLVSLDELFEPVRQPSRAPLPRTRKDAEPAPASLPDYNGVGIRPCARIDRINFSTPARFGKTHRHTFSQKHKTMPPIAHPLVDALFESDHFILKNDAED